MKKTAKLAVLIGLGATLCLAETWTGKLVDTNCKEQGKAQPSRQATTCDPSAATTAFAIETSDGKVLKLDSAGNSQAAQALKRVATKGSPDATVTGSMQGSDTIKVEALTIQ
jgi:hypothetical protein